jgi:hypothetical protein
LLPVAGATCQEKFGAHACLRGDAVDKRFRGGAVETTTSGNRVDDDGGAHGLEVYTGAEVAARGRWLPRDTAG